MSISTVETGTKATIKFGFDRTVEHTIQVTFTFCHNATDRRGACARVRRSGQESRRRGGHENSRRRADASRPCALICPGSSTATSHAKGKTANTVPPDWCMPGRRRVRCNPRFHQRHVSTIDSTHSSESRRSGVSGGCGAARSGPLELQAKRVAQSSVNTFACPFVFLSDAERLDFLCNLNGNFDGSNGSTRSQMRRSSITTTVPSVCCRYSKLGGDT